MSTVPSSGSLAARLQEFEKTARPFAEQLLRGGASPDKTATLLALQGFALHPGSLQLLAAQLDPLIPHNERTLSRTRTFYEAEEQLRTLMREAGLRHTTGTPPWLRVRVSPGALARWRVEPR